MLTVAPLPAGHSGLMDTGSRHLTVLVPEHLPSYDAVTMFLRRSWWHCCETSAWRVIKCSHLSRTGSSTSSFGNVDSKRQRWQKDILSWSCMYHKQTWEKLKKVTQDIWKTKNSSISDERTIKCFNVVFVIVCIRVFCCMLGSFHDCWSIFSWLSTIFPLLFIKGNVTRSFDGDASRLLPCYIMDFGCFSLISYWRTLHGSVRAFSFTSLFTVIINTGPKLESCFSLEVCGSFITFF